MEDSQELQKKLLKKGLKIRELEGLATKDPLTRVLNRRGFLEMGNKLYSHVKFQQENRSVREHFRIEFFSILFMDIDNFKKINDTYGHAIGDKILQYVFSIAADKVRSSDFVGRWGGEEVVVALVGASEKDAAIKAEEIRRAVKNRIKIPGLPDLKVTVSIGVAEQKPNVSLEELVDRADKAMYQAKTTGKDKVVKFSGLETRPKA